MKQEPLTPRQHEYYEAILYYWRTEGRSPSVREICERVGGVATNAVMDTLRALTRKGWLNPKEYKTVRTIVPVGLKIEHQSEGHMVFWKNGIVKE